MWPLLIANGYWPAVWQWLFIVRIDLVVHNWLPLTLRVPFRRNCSHSLYRKVTLCSSRRVNSPSVWLRCPGIRFLIDRARVSNEVAALAKRTRT